MDNKRLDIRGSSVLCAIVCVQRKGLKVKKRHGSNDLDKVSTHLFPNHVHFENQYTGVSEEVRLMPRLTLLLPT